MSNDLNASLHPGWQSYWSDHRLEYKRYEYKLLPHDIVIDLGAYQGQFAEEIHRQHGCNVICVEPTDSIQRLANKDWVTIIQKAAGTKDGVARFGGMFYYTSLFEDDEKYGFKDFQTFDVNTLLSQEVALLKVNIEGMEYELMNHIMDQGFQKNVQHFQVQFHIISHLSETEWKVIAKRLYETHKISWRFPFVWESWERK